MSLSCCFGLGFLAGLLLVDLVAVVVADCCLGFRNSAVVEAEKEDSSRDLEA